MKYLYYYLPLLLLLGFVISSCDEDTTGPDGDGAEGSVFVQSNPSGAEIFIGGSSRGFTPDTILGLSAGSVQIRLELDEYSDTTFSVTVQEDQVINTGVIQLQSDVSVEFFGPDTLWEYFGTSASQHSGLDLSSGNTYAVSGPNGSVVDLYYFSNSTGTVFELRTPDGLDNNDRVSSFKLGDASDLNDGVNSPLVQPDWGDNVGDHETRYFFVYDHDGHYSKVKVVDWNEGAGDAWIIVEWIYNTVANDTRFP